MTAVIVPRLVGAAPIITNVVVGRIVGSMAIGSRTVVVVVVVGRGGNVYPGSAGIDRAKTGPGSGQSAGGDGENGCTCDSRRANEFAFGHARTV